MKEIVDIRNYQPDALSRLDEAKNGLTITDGMQMKPILCASYSYGTKGSAKARASSFVLAYSLMHRTPCIVSGTDEGKYEDIPNAEYRKTIKKAAAQHRALVTFALTPLYDSTDAVHIYTPVSPRTGKLYDTLAYAVASSFSDVVNGNVAIVNSTNKHADSSLIKEVGHDTNVPAIEIAVNIRYLDVVFWPDIDAALTGATKNTVFVYRTLGQIFPYRNNKVQTKSYY